MGMENGGQFRCPQLATSRQAQVTKGSDGKEGVRGLQKAEPCHQSPQRAVRQGRWGEASMAVLNGWGLPLPVHCPDEDLGLVGKLGPSHIRGFLCLSSCNLEMPKAGDCQAGSGFHLLGLLCLRSWLLSTRP